MIKTLRLCGDMEFSRPLPPELDRIVIVGSNCSGKTTIPKQVAATLQVPHIDLDALHWLPKWQENPASEFKELVSSSVAIIDRSGTSSGLRSEP